MSAKVYVDGQEGTTGIEIAERLEGRTDLELLRIDPDKRKDPAERRKLLNRADFVFLCLPDDAAREAVAMIDNPAVRVLDASTAHRTNPDWVYGIPELSAAQRGAVAGARRVAVPGCYATGFVMLMRPLVDAGVVPADYPATCFAVSGYSGAGKKAIAQYEQAPGPDNADELFRLASPRLYALGLGHKHLPEMRLHAGLAAAPLFSPIIANVYKGMIVNVPLLPALLPGRPGPAEIREALAARYAGKPFVRVAPYEAAPGLDGGFLHLRACDGTNRIELYVFGHADQVLLSARLDNLGKGASGAAVQCMNIMLGVDEATGLKA